MARRIGPERIRGRVHPFFGIAVVLSLFVGSVAVAFHSHEEAESVAECSVCHVAQNPGLTAKPDSPSLAVLDRFQVSAVPGYDLAPAALHFSPQRSRAPPLTVSL